MKAEQTTVQVILVPLSFLTTGIVSCDLTYKTLYLIGSSESAGKSWSELHLKGLEHIILVWNYLSKI